MKKDSMISVYVLIFFWLFFSMLIDNEYLLPGPFDVLSSMWQQLRSDDFLISIASTTFRTLKGCLISLIISGTLGILSGNSRRFQLIIEPVVQIIKTIPNITYMILILIWAGQENSVTVIVFFILFPVFYSLFKNKMELIRSLTKDLLYIYPVTTKEKWLKIDLPMLLPEVFSGLYTGIGMGFKVCVMAEILSQVKEGIGRQMNYGRLNLDIAAVFGWTCWIMLISILLQQMVKIVQKLINGKVSESVHS